MLVGCVVRVYCRGAGRFGLIGDKAANQVPGAGIGVQHVGPVIVMSVEQAEYGLGVRARGPGQVYFAAVQEYRALYSLVWDERSRVVAGAGIVELAGVTRLNS